MFALGVVRLLKEMSKCTHTMTEWYPDYKRVPSGYLVCFNCKKKMYFTDPENPVSLGSWEKLLQDYERNNLKY